MLKTLRAPNQFISERFPCPALLYPALPNPPGMDVDAPTGGAASGVKADAWVVSGSENGNVVIWELSSRRVAQVLAEGGHRKPVVALAVSVFMPRPEPSLINPGQS